MTSTTEETQAVPVEEMDLEQYKAHVRAEALRVQQVQGWCDEGLNEALERLGLTPKLGPVRVPVEVSTTRTVVMIVEDADTLEEAYAKADDAEYLRRHLSVYYTQGLTSNRLAPMKDPDELTVGDFDTSYESLHHRRCENRNDDIGYFCTRRSDHRGRQHVASDSDRIVQAVWPY